MESRRPHLVVQEAKSKHFSLGLFPSCQGVDLAPRRPMAHPEPSRTTLGSSWRGICSDREEGQEWGMEEGRKGGGTVAGPAEPWPSL